MIRVKVLLFSVLRDIAGCGEILAELSKSEPTIADAIATLYELQPGIQEWDAKLLVALNSEYAERTATLSDGDELALMPPVQGG